MNSRGRSLTDVSLLPGAGPVAAAILGVVTGIIFLIAPLPDSPASAQRVRSDEVWRVVYEKLPDFPKENQYVSLETGKVNPDNTLVSRLIRYHIYTKGRPPVFRLDWKLTLAEYLEVAGAMDTADYPGVNQVRGNPAPGDIAAIKKLNRVQRDALVQALVDGFTANTARVSMPTPLSSPQSSPAVPTANPRSPR
ncbi:MAG: hypothetical protein ACKO24_04150 [Leptolyngbyaceae cyanobacterium]